MVLYHVVERRNLATSICSTVYGRVVHDDQVIVSRPLNIELDRHSLCERTVKDCHRVLGRAVPVASCQVLGISQISIVRP